MIGVGGRYDRTACRDMPRGGARETTERPVLFLQLGRSDNRHRRAVVWLVANSRSLSSVAVRGQKRQGRRRLLVLLCTLFYPETGGTGFCLRACTQTAADVTVECSPKVAIYTSYLSLIHI